jgi:hypothetical protein
LVYLDRLVQRLGAYQLLGSGRALLEGLLRVVGHLHRDRLNALVEIAEALEGEVHIVLAELLEVFETVDHCMSSFRQPCRANRPGSPRCIATVIYAMQHECQESFALHNIGRRHRAGAAAFTLS